MQYSTVLAELLSIDNLLFSIIFFMVGLYLQKKLGRDTRLVEFAKQIPGPLALPVLGNSWTALLFGDSGMVNLIGKYMRLPGTRFRLWIGKHLVVVLTDIRDIETVILSPKTLEKPDVFAPLVEFFGSSSMTFAPTPIWRKTRKTLQPFFLKKNIQHLMPILHETIQKNVDAMKNHVDGGEFNFAELFAYFYFDIMMKCYYGTELTEFEKNEFNLKKQIEMIYENCMTKIWKPWYYSPFFSRVMMGSKYDKAKFEYKKLGEKILNSNGYLEKNDFQEDELSTENFGIKFLSTLVSDLRAQGVARKAAYKSLGLAVGGNLTMGATVSYFLLAVAMYPEIQNKLYNELYESFGDEKRPLKVADLDKLLYMEQVLKEVQRRFTMMPFIGKKVNSDIRIGDLIYPAGTNLFLSSISIHLNPNIYPDPLIFNPDNFSAEAMKSRPRNSFLAFSGGLRNCIGKYYATITMKYLLAVLLLTYSFETNVKIEDIKPSAGVNARNEFGCPVSIKWRK